MGYNVANISNGIDHSTGEKFIEFHRRLVLTDAQYKQVLNLLENNNVEECHKYLLTIIPENAVDVTNFFMNELKNLKITENVALESA